jgi:DNA polymerase II small subunit
MSGEIEQRALYRLMEEGYQVSPEAAAMICSHADCPHLVDHILSHIKEDVFIIDVDDFEEFREQFECSCRVGSQGTAPPAILVSGDNPVTVLSDITDSSTCVGEYMEFVHYFRNRYSRLSEMIRGRLNSRPLESLVRNRRRGDGDYGEVSIIGMVSDLRSTSNGHRLIQFEDPTGSFPVLFTTSEKELFEQAGKLVLDDVVGVSGKLTGDGRMMIAGKLVFPDVPNSGFRQGPGRGKALFISDVHVGSTTFLKEQWECFIEFLRGESPDPDLNALSRELRYLVVAGDIVDGVGIYPGQEDELVIKDVYEQYEKAAEYFNQVPEHISIVISPGNHDAVRQAEPQPALPARIRSMFDRRIIFVGNPALVDLDGVLVLMYHGRSIDDFVATVPGVSYQEPAKAMVEMIKRRHLSPIYGNRVSIAPEKQDHFVIDRIPHILHCGHVHTVGVERYRGVLLLNSGTWQSQTEFQKRVNLVPTPAQVPVVDLSSFRTTLLQF